MRAVFSGEGGEAFKVCRTGLGREMMRGEERMEGQLGVMGEGLTLQAFTVAVKNPCSTMSHHRDFPKEGMELDRVSLIFLKNKADP